MLDILQFLLGLGNSLFARGDFVLRRNPDHIAVLAFVQTLGLQHQVEGLVPRHVDQTQGDVAGNRVGHNDIQIRHLGDQLQHRPGRNVLEIEGHAIAGIHRRRVRIRFRLFLLRRHLDHIFVARLISKLIKRAACGDFHFHATALAAGFDGFDRRREVEHIEFLRQLCWQADVVHVHVDLVAKALQVDAGALAVERDDDTTFAMLAATEVDIRDLHARSDARLGLVGRGNGGGGRGCCAA